MNSNYDNTCRYCDPVVQVFTSCAPNYNCPSGYYKEHGICYVCPVGCSTCTNSTYCTACKTGLQFYSSSVSSMLCICPNGYYGEIIVS